MIVVNIDVLEIRCHVLEVEVNGVASSVYGYDDIGIVLLEFSLEYLQLLLVLLDADMNAMYHDFTVDDFLATDIADLLLKILLLLLIDAFLLGGIQTLLEVN